MTQSDEYQTLFLLWIFRTLQFYCLSINTKQNILLITHSTITCDILTDFYGVLLNYRVLWLPVFGVSTTFCLPWSGLCDAIVDNGLISFVEVMGAASAGKLGEKIVKRLKLNPFFFSKECQYTVVRSGPNRLKAKWSCSVWDWIRPIAGRKAN